MKIFKFILVSLMLIALIPFSASARDLKTVMEDDYGITIDSTTKEFGISGELTLNGEARVLRELDFNAGAITAPTTGVEGAITFTVYDGPPQIRYSTGDIVVYNDIYYQVVQTLFNSSGTPDTLTPTWYTVIESLGAEWITFGMKGA